MLSMVLQKAAWLMGIGIVIGAVSAWQLSATVRTFLFEVQPNDSRIFALALVMLGTVGFVASALPRAAPRASTRWLRFGRIEELSN